MITVQFLKPHPPFNAGERASFDDAAAAELLARGIVALDYPSPSAAPTAAEDSPPPLAPAKGKKA